MLKSFMYISILICMCGTVSLQADESEVDIPDYRRLMLINSILPGYAQIQMDKRTEGFLYMSSIPLKLAGEGILLVTIFRNLEGLKLSVRTTEDKTYLVSYRDDTIQTSDYILLFSGMTLTLYGTLLSSYSQYEAHRTYMDRYAGYLGLNPVRSGADRLIDLIFAPFKPKNVFDPLVLPALAFSTAGSLISSDVRSIGSYFTRDSVLFWGSEVSPWTGLGLAAGTSLLFVWANALWEEIAFRGFSLETMGTGYSSLTFGLAHLPNMLVPGISVEDTVLQTIAAIGYGFYSAELTKQNGYRLEKAAAFHFWNNMFALVLGYLSDPDDTPGFHIGYRLSM